MSGAPWLVRLDDGKANSYHSLSGAASAVDVVLSTGTPCEILPREDDGWVVWRRYEPQADDDRYYIDDDGGRRRKHEVHGGPHDEPPAEAQS